MLSPGPGTRCSWTHWWRPPEDWSGRTPIMGICLDVRLRHLFGATTYKLKFDHRGANHPVRDELTGRVYITSQNHGYAVDGDRLDRRHAGGADPPQRRRGRGAAAPRGPYSPSSTTPRRTPGPHDAVFLFDAVTWIGSRAGCIPSAGQDRPRPMTPTTSPRSSGADARRASRSASRPGCPSTM